MWDATRDKPIMLQMRMRNSNGSVILWGRGTNPLRYKHWIGFHSEPGEED